jgi:hypothetical protein
MAIHKIRDDDQTKTLCGRDVWDEEIEASIHWEDVTCKKCRKKNKKKNKKN